MTPTECELTEGVFEALDEEQLVLCWRIDQLCLLGFDPGTAATLANGGIDLNAARTLMALMNEQEALRNIG